ncbi:LysR family transcriptional regulator [Rhodoferax aquaticus]|uniref:LysR family transcriptional regulator n=1 Tax=Rhodoferax aquaticus TaxID=2527691 RepID=A0A515EKU6_9BURK|nr:LysR family transcriptional regulator [Rhodoferax aquaticus]QDL53293.1 LysR family transcriptional regulator [Rhodoferax aquaticus]
MPTLLKRLQRVTPQQLRAFESTARLRSVTRAAQELHVSQPTVSIQLREIALAVGEPLFETVGRQLRLTQAGEAMQDAANEITGCWQRFETRMAEVHGLLRGRLRIAAVTTAEYFVPDLLGPFAAAHPGVDIELTVENRDRVVDRLQRSRDDLSVMMLPPDELPLDTFPFLDNPLVVIAAADHPLAGKRLTLSRLAKARWLMREPGSGTRMAAEQHFARVGFEPHIAMSLGSNEAIKHAVSAGLGLAVVSRLAVADIVDTPSPARGPQLVQLKVSGFPIRRQWLLVWRRDQPMSAAAKRFVSYLRESRPSRASLAH